MFFSIYFNHLLCVISHQYYVFYRTFPNLITLKVIKHNRELEKTYNGVFTHKLECSQTRVFNRVFKIICIIAIFNKLNIVEYLVFSDLLKEISIEFKTILPNFMQIETRRGLERDIFSGGIEWDQ